MTLQGKVIIVTGASKGIGRATACLLAERGAHVILAARSPKELEEVSRTIESRRGISRGIPTDIRDESDVKVLMQQAQGYFGRIDVLINNAGRCIFGPLSQASLADWEEVMETNLKGVFLCTREVIPIMIRQGEGHIITVASQAGKFGLPNLAIYCASKFGVIGFSEALKQELNPYRIKVSYLCPGYVNTGLLKAFPEETLSQAKMAQPQEVAEHIFREIAGPRERNSQKIVLKKLFKKAIEQWIPPKLG